MKLFLLIFVCFLGANVNANEPLTANRSVSDSVSHACYFSRMKDDGLYHDIEHPFEIDNHGGSIGAKLYWTFGEIPAIF